MPFIGLGVHVLIALYFAIHAVRSGQNMYWLIILFSFPLLGSLVYFFAVYLPDSRLEHGAKKAVASAARALDPTRELREARAAFDYTATAQNRIRLAEALLDAGDSKEAAAHFEACLTGPFEDDLNIRLSAARANFENETYTKAIEHLEFIRSKSPQYRGDVVTPLLARALAGAGRIAEAKAEFESGLAQFGGFEIKAEYLIWALTKNDREIASRLQADVQNAIDHLNKHARQINRPLLRRLDAAYKLSQQAN